MATALAVALSFTGALGCSDDHNSNPNPNPNSTSDPNNPKPPAGPLYAVGAITYSASGAPTAYVALTNSLAKGTQLDYTRVLEVPGYARIFGVPSHNQFFVTDPENLSIDKYTVSATGEMKQEGALSLAANGITTYANKTIEMIDDTTAYLFDNEGYQVIVWDPTAMTVKGHIDLSGLKLDNWPVGFAFDAARRRGDQVIAYAYYADLMQETLAKESRVIVIDTKTQKATILKEARCGGLANSVFDKSGDLYISTESFGAAVNALGHGSPSCIVRVRAGQDTIDPDYLVDPATLTDGKPTGGMVPGQAGTVFLRSLDETVAPINAMSKASGLLSAPAWAWWRVDLASGKPGTAVKSLPLSTGGISFYEVDGEVYSNNTKADYSETTLIRTTTPDEPETLLTARGWLFDVVRVR